VAEVRRLVLALAAPAERRTFHLDWSRWRRRHQAAAAQSHVARRARGRDQPRPSTASAPTPPPATATTDVDLTAAEWEAVLPLLPPQRPPVGRPPQPHRTVLSGIVWVVRNHASWRAMPPECGKWETVYKRYRLWRASGLWQRLAAVLGLDAAPSTAEVSL
jgi:Putative transposase of IS4/5 family (DUF4096)